MREQIIEREQKNDNRDKNKQKKIIIYLWMNSIE